MSLYSKMPHQEEALKERSALGKRGRIFIELSQREVSRSSASSETTSQKRSSEGEGVAFLDWQWLAGQFRFYQKEEGGEGAGMGSPEGQERSYLVLWGPLPLVYRTCPINAFVGLMVYLSHPR